MLVVSKLHNGTYINVGGPNWDIVLSDENDDCWKIVEPQTPTPEPTFDPVHLNRLHIITVFIVGLLGSILVLFLLVCACLNNETVAEMVCRKKTHLPKKGIDGYFPFGAGMTSPGSSNIVSPTRVDDDHMLGSLEIPILIEPSDALRVQEGALGASSIPMKPLSQSLASDDISYGSIMAIDDLSESPKSKKMDYLDTYSIKTDC